MNADETTMARSDSRYVRVNFLLLFGGLLSVYCLWLLAYFPGCMSPDSIHQWKQAESGIVGDWHPYLSTYFVMAMQSIGGGSPVAVALVQIGVTACVIAFAYARAISMGVKPAIVGFGLAFAGLSVPIGLYNITLWKDVLFAIAIGYVGLLFVLKGRRGSLWSRTEILLMLLASVVMTMFRHNGVAYLGLFPVAFLLAFRSVRWRYYFVGAFISCVIFLKMVLPYLVPFDHEQKPFWMTGFNLFAYHMGVGVYSKAPQTRITPEFSRLVEQVFDSPESARAAYDPRIWNNLYWNVHVRKDVLNSERFWREFTPEFYGSILLPNLVSILKDKARAFVGGTNGFYGTHANSFRKDRFECVPNNSLGISVSPRSDLLKKVLDDVVNTVDRVPALRHLIWNAAIPILVLMWVLGTAIVKRSESLAWGVSISLIQVPFIFTFNVASDWRYYYLFYFSFVLLWPFFFVKADWVRKT